MKNSILPLLVLVSAATWLSCSSSGGPSGGTQEGGSPGGTSAAGASGSGGKAGTGGVVDTGGQGGTGGVATGGVATGGVIVGGGQAGTGGTASGGAPQTGGNGGSAGSSGTAGSAGTAGQGGGKGGTNVGGSTGGTGGSASGGSGGSGSAGSTGAGTPSAGCGKTPTLTSGPHKIQSAGQSRDYIIRIPATYDKSHPYRLVFGFHWQGGTKEDVDGGGTSGAAWSYFGLQAQANDSTIFVAGQGLGGGWGNGGGQDLTFVDDMLKLIKDDLCVDTSRIFSVGFSWGGGMTYELACARASVFRAVAVYSGAVLSGCDDGSKPIAYLGIHGVSDDRCAYGGGESLRSRFVKNNGCTDQVPPKPAVGSGKHICTQFTGCKDGYPLEWCAFDGGHTPGNVDGGGDDGAKTWTKGEVWKFFTQF